MTLVRRHFILSLNLQKNANYKTQPYTYVFLLYYQSMIPAIPHQSQGAKCANKLLIYSKPDSTLGS